MTSRLIGGDRRLDVTRSIAIVLAMLFSAAVRASGQEPSEPADTASNAFPVPSSVRVVPDLVYAQYGKRQLKLDLYLPSQSDRSRAIPGVIVVRGGGWQAGDKEAFGFVAGQLAKEGFAAASVEYRTSVEAKFPGAVHDVKAAVRWMRASASVYGIDPSAIGAMGGSAGAHLVAMLATSAGVDELEGSGGNSAVSSQVQAVVAMACACNLNMTGEAGRAVAEFDSAPNSRAGSPLRPRS